MQQAIHSNDGNEINCTVSLKRNFNFRITFTVFVQEENGWCDVGTYEKLRALSNGLMLARAKELNIIT